MAQLLYRLFRQLFHNGRNIKVSVPGTVKTLYGQPAGNPDFFLNLIKNILSYVLYMHISDSIKIGFQYFQRVASRSGNSSFAELTRAIPSVMPSFESFPTFSSIFQSRHHPAARALWRVTHPREFYPCESLQVCRFCMSRLLQFRFLN